MARCWLSLVVAAGAMGCVSYQMSVTTPTPGPSRTSTCDFRVLNLPPGGGEYEEIATLTPARGRATTPEEFKEAVKDDVCHVGGDVVLAEINGQGWYVRGTVLRKRAPTAPAPAPAAVPPAPAAVPAAPAAVPPAAAAPPSPAP